MHRNPLTDGLCRINLSLLNPSPIFGIQPLHQSQSVISLPKALMGLGITKAGMEEITLCPALLGLEAARTELLTPYGKVTCTMRKGENEQITHPKEITVHYKV